jgi:hypothetical protein
LQQSLFNLIKAGIKPALLFFLLYFSNLNLHAETIKLDLALDSYWLKLIHYKKYPWGYRSEIDFPNFFLSSSGKTHPEKELQATIEKSSDQSIVCRYPARFEWLNQMGLTKINFEKCDEYQNWLKGLEAKSLSLVFASYYPENPASAFGHLFLKIDHEEKGHLPELDYIVNFAAAAEEDGGLMYALKGLTGGYKGIFTIEKYYQKIQEYEIHESRDLWEFKLDLQPSEVKRVLAHLWELTYSAYFDYYFFDENCSYQILKLIEVAKNESYHKSYSPYQIPEENLFQIIDHVGLKELPTQRFSLFKQTQARISNLDKEDQKYFNLSIKRGTFNIPQASPALLDAYQYLLQLKQIQKKPLSSNDKKLNHQILLAISKKETPSIINIKKGISPLDGHRSHKISLGHGLQNQQQFTSLKFKPAFHEIMDDDRSYLPNSSLNILGFEGRYSNNRQKFNLQEVVLLETQVISPFSRLSTKPSWGADFSMRTLNYLNCSNCQSYQLKLSRGISFNFFEDKLTTYAFFHGLLQNLVHEELGIKQFRIGPEIEWGVILRIRDSVKLRTAFNQQYNFTHQFSPQAYMLTEQLSFYPQQNISINLELKKNLGLNSTEIKKYQEYLGLVSFYY